MLPPWWAPMALNTRVSRNASRAKTSPAWAWSTPKRSRSSSARGAPTACWRATASSSSSPKASGMTSLPRSCSRPPRWAASTSAPERSARAPATAATWLACTCSRPREAPPVPGASSKNRQTAASRARRPTLTRPTRVTAWRTVCARTGRAHAAELAKRRTLAASPGSVSIAATSSLVSDSGSPARSRTRRRARSRTGSWPMRPMASCRAASTEGECCGEGSIVLPPIFGSADQELSGGRRRAARFGRASRPLSGAQRGAGGADAGVAAPGPLWAEPRFVSLTLGVTIALSLRTRGSTRCFTAPTSQACGPADEPHLLRSEEVSLPGLGGLRGLLPSLLLGGLQLLLDDSALVVGDLQALLQEGDRVGRAATQAQGVAQVVERVGVADLAPAPLGAEGLDRALQGRHGVVRLALPDESEALVVERDRVVGLGLRRRRGRRGRRSLGGRLGRRLRLRGRLGRRLRLRGLGLGLRRCVRRRGRVLGRSSAAVALAAGAGSDRDGRACDDRERGERGQAGPAALGAGGGHVGRAGRRSRRRLRDRRGHRRRRAGGGGLAVEGDLEGVHEGRGGRRALRGVLGHPGREHLTHARRQPGAGRARRGHALLDVGAGLGGRVVGREGPATGEQLEGDDGQRVAVAGVGRRVAARLLWRDVGGGA